MRKNLTTAGNRISKSEIGNNNHHRRNKSMYVFFISVIALGLVSVSLSLLATIANAQTTSDFTSGAKSTTTSNESGVKQMGICVVGAGGPCNNNNVR